MTRNQLVEKLDSITDILTATPSNFRSQGPYSKELATKELGILIGRLMHEEVTEEAPKAPHEPTP